MKKIVLGLTAGRKYDNYLRYLSQVPEVEIIKLGYEDQNFELITKCNGLVLSGGEDVHPRFYNKPEYLEEFGLDDLDEERDAFELKAIAYAHQHAFPILGICRGLQIVNVYFGGTLVPDIPSFQKPDHSKYAEGNDRYHVINIVKNSLLASIAGVETGEVNSAHHQSADLIGTGLAVNAVSADQVVEGLEYEDKSGAYLLLVQWHPERMKDPQSPLSENVRDSFMAACRK